MNHPFRFFYLTYVFSQFYSLTIFRVDRVDSQCPGLLNYYTQEARVVCKVSR